MATYLPIVPLAYQWLTFWPMVIYMELLWMFISIIFHIADLCSLSYGQTIKCTGQLQYTRIYLEKCRDKNCMIIFKIEKPRAIPQVDDYSTVLITFTIWIQTHGKIITVQNKLQMFCFNHELEKFSILSSCSGKINHCKSCQIGTQELAPWH